MEILKKACLCRLLPSHVLVQNVEKSLEPWRTLNGCSIVNGLPKTAGTGFLILSEKWKT